MPSPGNPQTLNRYTYCGNNPLKYIDSSGHLFNVPKPPRPWIIIDPPFDLMFRALSLVCSSFEFFSPNPWGIIGEGYLSSDYLSGLPEPVKFDDPVTIYIVSEEGLIFNIMDWIILGERAGMATYPKGIIISDKVDPEFFLDYLLLHELFHY